MKKVLFFTLSVTVFLGAAAQKIAKAPVKGPEPVIKNLLDSFSYMAGLNVASNMKEQGITEINLDLMKKGMDDFLKTKTPLIPVESGNGSLQRQLNIFAKKKALLNKAACDAFLENNKKRKGVISLPDGLQYEIIKSPDSATNKPTLADTVVVNYIGTQINGVEFDNSYKRGVPAIFSLGRVIRGWVEILQMMPVGSHWKVYIPSELAYGDDPPPGSNILPGATLIFDLLLEGIKPAAK